MSNQSGNPIIVSILPIYLLYLSHCVGGHEKKTPDNKALVEKNFHGFFFYKTILKGW